MQCTLSIMVNTMTFYLPGIDEYLSEKLNDLISDFFDNSTYQAAFLFKFPLKYCSV